MDYSYSYTYDTTTSNASIDAGAFLAFLGFMFVFMIISYIITSFLLGRVFKKAGVPQWAAWVPIYNTWKILELGNQQGFWALFAIIPFVNIVTVIFMYIAMYHIGLKFKKEGWFVLLAIFLPLVWLIWLGFDDSTWPREKEPVKIAGPGAQKATAAKKPSVRKKKSA